MLIALSILRTLFPKYGLRGGLLAWVVRVCLQGGVHSTVDPQERGSNEQRHIRLNDNATFYMIRYNQRRAFLRSTGVPNSSI